jgi:hypothetical protein
MRVIVFVPTTELEESSCAALEFAESARVLGHEILLLGLFRGGQLPASTPLGERANEQRATFRILQQRFVVDPGLLGQMEAVVSRFRPDVFQSRGTAGTIVSRPPFSRGVGWQAILEGPRPLARESMPGSWPARRFALAMFRRADQVLVDDDEAAAYIAARGIKRERIATLPRDESEIERARAILELADKVRRR